MRICTIVPAGVVLLALSAARAEVESGPSPGDSVEPLKVYAVTGEVEGKEVDYAKLRGKKPSVYVFIQAEHWSRPMARFLRKIDEAAQNIDGAYVVAVWLTEDEQQTKEYLPRAQGSLKLQSTALTLYPDAEAGPDGWGINQQAYLTAVVANGAKVVESFGYVSVNETVAPDVEKALKKALQSD